MTGRRRSKNDYLEEVPCLPKKADYTVFMIFSKKNAGKWVASKNGETVESARKLETLLKKVEKRTDRKDIRFDKAPSTRLFAG